MFVLMFMLAWIVTLTLFCIGWKRWQDRMHNQAVTLPQYASAQIIRVHTLMPKAGRKYG